MGATFVVTLREGFEAALLLGIVYAYLQRTGSAHHRGWVTAGAVLGFVASIGLGVIVSVVSGPLLDIGPDLIAAAVMLVAVALLTWHGWWMQQNARGISGDVRRRVDAARSSGRLSLLGLIAFTAVFREGAETVLFLWGLMAQAPVGGWSGLAGAAAGVAMAAVLGWLVFRGGQRLPVGTFFSVTSALLILVAGGLLSSAVGRLQVLGFVPATPELWDTTWLLEDGRGVGGFVAGLLGYRARPTWLEAGAWLAYLVAAGVLLWRPAREPVAATARTTASGAEVCR